MLKLICGLKDRPAWLIALALPVNPSYRAFPAHMNTVAGMVREAVASWEGVTTHDHRFRRRGGLAEPPYP